MNLLMTMTQRKAEGHSSRRWRLRETEGDRKLAIARMTSS